MTMNTHLVVANFTNSELHEQKAVSYNRRLYSMSHAHTEAVVSPNAFDVDKKCILQV